MLDKCSTSPVLIPGTSMLLGADQDAPWTLAFHNFPTNGVNYVISTFYLQSHLLGSPAFLPYPISPLLPAAPVWVWLIIYLQVKGSRPITFRFFLEIFLEQIHRLLIPWPHSSPMSGMTHVYGTSCLYILLSPWQTLLMDPAMFSWELGQGLSHFADIMPSLYLLFVPSLGLRTVFVWSLLVVIWASPIYSTRLNIHVSFSRALLLTVALTLSKRINTWPIALALQLQLGPVIAGY